MSYFDDRYRHPGRVEDGYDVRGLPCQWCKRTIRFPYTYQGLGIFCSEGCAHQARDMREAEARKASA